jgi:hypothetical protein
MSLTVSFITEAETGRIFYYPPRLAPKKVFPTSPLKKLSPPRFLKVFPLTVLTPEAATERIFYSPPRLAPKKVFPTPPRFGLWFIISLNYIRSGQLRRQSFTYVTDFNSIIDFELKFSFHLPSHCTFYLNSIL